MAIVLRTLLGNVADLIKTDFDPDTTQVWIVSNAPDQAIQDKTSNQTLLGSAPVVLASDGTFSVANIVDYANTSGDVQPTGIQYELFVSYRDHGTGESRTWRSGMMQVTANNQQVTAILGSGSTVAPAYASQFIRKDLVDAKGDLLVATAADAVARKAVGSNGALLVGDSAQADGLRWTTTRYLEGTGSPEGVVTAPVGARYVDTDATMGAVEWIKATGSGNTGWQVVHGNTGRRKITPLNSWAVLAGGGTSFDLILTRVRDDVALTGYLDRTTATDTAIYALPSGFRPPNYHTVSVPTSIGTPNINQTLEIPPGAASVRVYGTATTIYISTMWKTSDPWPTSLPGTAA